MRGRTGVAKQQIIVQATALPLLKQQQGVATAARLSRLQQGWQPLLLLYHRRVATAAAA
jgi:hypothetical protein